MRAARTGARAFGGGSAGATGQSPPADRARPREAGRRALVLLLCLLIALSGLASLAPLDREQRALASPAPPDLARPEPAAASPAGTTVAAAAPRALARPVDGQEALPARGHGAAEARPFLLAVGRGAAPARLAQALEQAVVADAYSVRRVAPSASADLYIGYDPPAGFHTVPLTATRFVPVVSYWLPVTEVAYADLERIFRGDVGTWAELGAPVAERVARLALATDPPPPLAPPAGPFLADTAALVSALEQLPGGIALVPLEQVDTRVRALRVDGHDALLEEEFVPGDPLVRQLYVAYSPGAPAAAAEWALALAQRQHLARPEPGIEVVIVGDIMPGRLVGRRLLSFGDYTCAFARVNEALSAADLTIANLEGALSDEIAPPDEPQTMLFVGSGRFVEGLRYAGVDGVSLANNHSRNFGGAGISDTLALLDAAGIATFGGGMNLPQARQPALFEVQGVRFAFLGYDAVSYYYAADEERAGTAPADPALIAADVAAAHEQADVVLTYFHWGSEYTHNPSTQQEELAHQAVEAGADVVLGNHPHWVQGLEHYRGVPIVYSIGNFVFDQSLSPETRQGVIAHLIFRGPRLVQLRLQAIQIEEYYQPVLLPSAAAQDIYRQMQEVSPEWTREKGATP